MKNHGELKKIPASNKIIKVYIKISIGKRKNNVHLSLFSCIKLNVFRVEIGIKSGKVKVVSFYAQFE